MGPRPEQVEGPKKNCALLSFWRRLRKRRHEQNDRVSMAEVSFELPSESSAFSSEISIEESVEQMSSQYETASSGTEDDGDELRQRIVRSRLGRVTTQAIKNKDLKRVRCRVDKQRTRSESDVRRPVERQRRRPMRQFNWRKPVPKCTKSDTELVRPTTSDWAEPSCKKSLERDTRHL